MIIKSLLLKLTVKQHTELSEIQLMDQKKNGYLKKRRMEAIAVDIYLAGIEPFKKQL